MRRISIALLFVFLSMFVTRLYAEAPAKPTMQEMRRWVHPYVSADIGYDSNVFLEPTHEQSDFIFKVTPGFFVGIPFSGARHALTLDYNVELAAYAEFDDQNSHNHNLTGSLDFNFPKFYAKTADKFRKTSLRSDTEFTEQIDRFENLYSLTLGTREFNRFTFEPGYEFYTTSYIDDEFEFLDYDTHAVIVKGGYRLFAKIRSTLEYRHTFISYPNATDIVGGTERSGDADRILFALSGELFKKMVGTVAVGYENREYDNNQDFSDIVFNASLTEYFSPRTALTLSYDRSPKESVFSSNDFYLANTVSLGLNQKLFWKFDGKLSFSYSNNGYDTAVTQDGVTDERTDDIYGIQAGLSYPVKDWLTTGLEYNYSQRDSNFSSLEYTDNRVLWKVSARY